MSPLRKSSVCRHNVILGAYIYNYTHITHIICTDIGVFPYRHNAYKSVHTRTPTIYTICTIIGSRVLEWQ